VPKFKNVGLDVHAQKNALAGGPLVASGEVFEVDGEVTAELDDGYVVGSGDDARVWPKAQWELVKSVAKVAKE
jgi:hypothetical protein